MKAKITALLYFYKEYTLYNWLFTLLTFDLLIRYDLRSLPYILWLKVIGYVATTIYYYYSRKKHLYFFHNLSQDAITLFSVSILFDVLTTVVSLYIINLLLR